MKATNNRPKRSGIQQRPAEQHTTIISPAFVDEIVRAQVAQLFARARKTQQRLPGETWRRRGALREITGTPGLSAVNNTVGWFDCRNAASLGTRGDILGLRESWVGWALRRLRDEKASHGIGGLLRGRAVAFDGGVSD
jgi:hypothetical protein